MFSICANAYWSTINTVGIIEASIERKALSGGRVTLEEAAFLLTEADIHWLGALAHEIRTERHGDRTYVVANRHINYTNICQNRCLFCSFGADAGDDGAYFLKPDEIVKSLKSDGVDDAREFHIVGAVPPRELADYGYFRRILTELRTAFPEVQLKAFTAVEIAWMAELSGMSVRDTLIDLKEAGLNAMPGGGAEVFAPEVRAKICPDKISGDEWLAVHCTAHELKIPTNATMLYGHVETPKQKAEHLLKLYDLQAETRGFQAFIPLAYHPAGNRLGGELTTGIEDLRHVAASRVALNNFPHIKAYWVEYGLKLAQVMLLWGADDMDGTVGHELIYHAAGASAPKGVTISELAGIIRDAGLKPIMRDALYRDMREFEPVDEDAQEV